MSDEKFEKLDAFMHRNVPQMSNIGSRKINPQKKLGYLEYVIVFGLSCIVGYTVIDHQNKKLENASALTDVLEWDVTSDEDFLEVDTIADLDI